MASCNDTCHTSEELSTKALILIPFSLLVGVPCIVLNAFISVIYIKKQKLRDNLYHCLVLMLSFSDLLVGFGYLSYTIQTLGYSSRGFSQVMCIMKTAFVVSGTLMSLCQTFLIGLQRYLVLFHTDWNNALFKGSRKYAVCFICWGVILIFSIALISPQQEYDSNTICHVEYVYNKHYVIFIAFNRFFVLILLITIIIYCVTLRYIIQINKKVSPSHVQQETNQQPSSSRSDEQSQRRTENQFDPTKDSPAKTSSEMQPNRPPNTGNLINRTMTAVGRRKLGNTVVLVGLLLGCLLVCTAPFFLSFIFPKVPNAFTVISACLCGLNSIINPILYSFKIRILRQTVKDIFTCT